MTLKAVGAIPVLLTTKDHMYGFCRHSIAKML